MLKLALGASHVYRADQVEKEAERKKP